MLNPKDLSEIYERKSGLGDLFASPQKPPIARPAVNPPSKDSLPSIISTLQFLLPREPEFDLYHVMNRGTKLQVTGIYSDDDWRSLAIKNTLERLWAVSSEDMGAPPTEDTGAPSSGSVIYFADNGNMPNPHRSKNNFMRNIATSNSRFGLAHQQSSQSQSAEALEAAEALRPSYESENWEAVQEFLGAHSELVSLLSEARSQLSRIFGEEATVRLNRVAEPGSTEGYSLFADVCGQEDPLLAFEQMSQFEEEWWLDASAQSKGLLHFGVEFA